MITTPSPHKWPAEWESQDATWISWPHNRETWPEHFHKIPEAFQRLISQIAHYQPVNVLAGPDDVEPAADVRLQDMPNVKVWPVPTDDAWIRDYGPTFVRRIDDHSLVGVNWRYNAWGGKYPPWDQDAEACPEICRILRCPFSRSPLHCEGGALEGNGRGMLLTTSSCLLSPARNPGWSREMIEEELRVQLGVQQIIWVDGGVLAGDDTDGHIDQIARFISPNVVVAATSSRTDDPNAAGLRENLRLLRQVQTPSGDPLTVYELPTPSPRFIGQQRVPESYCNFIFVNGAVIVPTFRSPATDQAALDLLDQLLPGFRIVPVDAYDLAWGLGTFHCATQHQPAPG